MFTDFQRLSILKLRCKIPSKRQYAVAWFESVGGLEPNPNVRYILLSLKQFYGNYPFSVVSRGTVVSFARFWQLAYLG